MFVIDSYALSAISPPDILDSRYSMTLRPMSQLSCVFELSVTHNFYVIRLLEVVSSSKIVLDLYIIFPKIGDKCISWQFS